MALLWATKPSASGTYTTMKTPSGYKLHGEDLDTNSYRSVVTGNINRTILGKKWVSVTLTFNYLTEAELETICAELNNDPMYVKLKSPVFGTAGIWEGEMYCNKYDVEMQQNKDNNKQTWHNLTFVLVQGKKVSGQ